MRLQNTFRSLLALALVASMSTTSNSIYATGCDPKSSICKDAVHFYEVKYQKARICRGRNNTYEISPNRHLDVNAFSPISRAVALALTDRDETVLNLGNIIVNVFSDGNGLFLTQDDLQQRSNVQRNKQTFGIGVRAKGGDDTVQNDGSLTVSTELVSTSFQSIFTRSQNNSVIPYFEASATGVDGGEGADKLINNGEITVTSNVAVNNTAVSLGGIEGAISEATSGSTAAIAESSAVGVDGNSGDDQIDNNGIVTVNVSSSITLQDVSLSAERLVGSGAIGKASSTAVGLQGSDDDDVINNYDELKVNASANVLSTNVAVNQEGISLSSDLNLDSGLQAEAMATGIQSNAGDDTVNNRGVIYSAANASVISTSVTGSYEGFASADTSSKSRATSVGLDAGEGDNTVNNFGTINADTYSEVISTNVAVTGQGSALSATGFWDQGTQADANSTGIQAGNGDDTITNQNVINVNASTFVVATDVAGVSTGVAKADTSVTAGASSTGIEAGDGDNVVSNNNRINVYAQTDLILTRVELSYEQVEIPGADTLEDLIYDGGTTTQTNATGIISGSGDDTINNANPISVKAESDTIIDGLGLTYKGEPGASVAFESETNATGIDAGEGANTITNRAELLVESDNYVIANTLSFAAEESESSRLTDIVGVIENFFADNESSKVVANATAITSGDDNDVINQQGTIEILAKSHQTLSTLDARYKGNPDVDLATVTEAMAMGIDAGDGENTVNQNGILTSNASVDAVITEVGIGVKEGDSSRWDDFTGVMEDFLVDGGISQSEATAIGLQSGDDNDIINNNGSTIVSSNTNIILTGVDFQYDGAPNVDLSSRMSSTSTGIQSQDGSDTIYNSGLISSRADSKSVVSEIALSKEAGETSGLEVILGEFQDSGATEVISNTIGIHTGLDNSGFTNTVENESIINATATTDATLDSISLAHKGDVSADISLISSANATGVKGELGRDHVTNAENGIIITTSRSKALAIGVAASTKGRILNVASDIISESSSKGVSTGINADVVNNDGIIVADAQAKVTDIGVTLDIGSKASGAFVSSSVEANTTAIGIETGIDTSEQDDDKIRLNFSGLTDKDTVNNNGSITAYAKSELIDVTGSIVNKGVAGSGVEASIDWKGGQSTQANATGVITGLDNDTVFSRGEIDVDAIADTLGVNFSLSKTGVAVALTSVEANADAVGIDSGEGDDDIGTYFDQDFGINVNAIATARGIGVAAGNKGVAASGNNIWDGGTTATSNATGIDSGLGNDDIDNGDIITATATSNALSANAAGEVTGFSATVMTSRAHADSVGIDVGEGENNITNSGYLFTLSDSEATSVGVSLVSKGVALAADAVWDGGTTVTANSTGIQSGTNKDSITNDGTLNINSKADSLSAQVGFALSGVSAATSTSTAISSATGINAGEGSNRINNTGDATVNAQSNADGISVSAAVKGLSLATDAVWDGGTKAKSTASGIQAGDGADLVENSGKLTAKAKSDTDSVSVSATLVGVSLGSSTSTADAIASAISAGHGENTITNSGLLTANAQSDAMAVGVSIAFKGVAGTTDALWEGGTTGKALAYGISSGDQSDTILNTGGLDVYSWGNTRSTQVATTVTGVSAAGATANANAGSVGIATNAGDDDIDNQGNFRVHADSDANAIGVSATAIGVSGTVNNFWDGGTKAESNALGISSGSGADIITNSGAVDVVSNADTYSIQVSVSGAGVAGLASSATAQANSIGIDSGDQNDRVTNINVINSTSISKARSIGVTATFGGLAGTWDAGTTAMSDAAAIKLGRGHDELNNYGSINAKATSETPSVQVSASLNMVGGAGVHAASDAISTVKTIEAGEGNDIINNFGNIHSDAYAKSNTTAISATLAAGIGFAGVWNDGTNATTTSYGIDTGTGNDIVTNDGRITVDSEAETGSLAVALTPTGASYIDSTMQAYSIGEGIHTAEGDDVIENNNLVDVNAKATAKARNYAVAITGAGIVDSDLDAFSFATGLSSGNGNDIIHNKATIDLETVAKAPSNAVSVAVIGYAGASQNNLAYTFASGIDGGEGNDIIINDGSIFLNKGGVTSARAQAKSVTVSILGAGNGNVNTTSTVYALGIIGQGGDDHIENSGRIEANALAYTESVGKSISITGYARNNSNLASNTKSVAMDGGDQNDTLVNRSGGDITANARSVGAARSSTISILGAGNSKANTSGVATAQGLEGGKGDDVVVNEEEASITTNASNSFVADASSWTFLGAAGSEAEIRAATYSISMLGSEGNDILSNRGKVIAKTSSSLTAKSNGTVIFGGVKSRAAVVSDAKAVGLEGGTGDDYIENFGSVDIDATASMSATGLAYGFAGGGTATATNISQSEGIGLNAGSGNDVINNYNLIDVDTSASIYSIGGTNSTVLGSNTTVGANLVSAKALGIAGESGNENIYNEGEVSTNVNVTSTIVIDADTGWLSGSGTATGFGVVALDSQTIVSNSGNDIIENNGVLKAEATSKNYISGKSDGADLFGGSASVYIDTRSTLNASGINVGDGNNIIRNNTDARIDAVINGRDDWCNPFYNYSVNAESCADADGDGAGGSGIAKAFTWVYATATGIKAGNGDNQIVNDGDINIISTPGALSQTIASDADFFSTAQGLSSTLVNSTAAGIDLGSGNNQIKNNGSMVIRSNPRAYAFSAAENKGQTNYVLEARAYAIRTQGGNNTIFNNGDITASTDLSGQASVFNDDSPAYYESVRSQAVAIQTGSGDDQIVNRGTITATANTQKLDIGIFVRSRAFPVTSQIATSAVAVSTGDGDDTVHNYGTITATNYTRGVQNFAPYNKSDLGTAILTGAGNDNVALYDGSVINGDINLGSGIDSLTFSGSPTINGNILSTDVMLNLLGEGGYQGELSVRSLIKQEAGVYSINMAQSVDLIEIQEGTVSITNDYALAETGELITMVFSNEKENGQLNIEGQVELQGTLKIERGEGIYQGETSYTVLTAKDGIAEGSEFSDINFPDETVLVSFDVEQTENSVEVNVDVKSFTTVADSGNETVIANVLDNQMSSATGELAQAIANVQAISDKAEFDTAFQSLSPESYANYAKASVSTSTQYNNSIQTRLNSLHLAKVAEQQIAKKIADKQLVIAIAGDEIKYLLDNKWVKKNQYGLWFKGFSQTGDQDVTSNSVGYGFDVRGTSIGMDKAFGNHLIGGISIGVANNDLDVGNGQNIGDIETELLSLYGSYAKDDWYLDFVFSQGENDYTNQRLVNVGGSTSTVTSSHSGDVTALTTRGAMLFTQGDVLLEPFMTLQYTLLSEDAFQESGPGVTLNVHSRDLDTLVSSIGLRVMKSYNYNNGFIVPEASISWKHDFDIDDNVISASYTDTPDSTFSVTSSTPDSDRINLGIGLTYQGPSGIIAGLHYNGEFSDSFDSHSIIGELRYQF